MPGFKNLRPLLAALIASCAVLVGAPVRAEVNEVRIGIQYGLIYLPVAVADAQGYFAEEAKKAGLPDHSLAICLATASTTRASIGSTWVGKTAVM